MKLVADSNVLFTFFWKNSAFRQISAQDVRIFSPQFALEEIDEHKEEIMQKTTINKNSFDLMLKELRQMVFFIPLEEYECFVNQAYDSVKGLPQNQSDALGEDIDFLALAMKYKCPVWSNDKLLKKQTAVDIVSTKELVLLVEPKEI